MGNDQALVVSESGCWHGELKITDFFEHYLGCFATGRGIRFIILH